MAKPIEVSKNIYNKYGLSRDKAVYPNNDGIYSPIVLEIEQIRERGIWANDPLITTHSVKNKKIYEEFFQKLYGNGNKLLLNFRLFEKRLYRWGWVGLLVRFYGKDTVNYNLEFESRKIVAVNKSLDTGIISRIDCIWYFSVDGKDYKVLEQWTDMMCERKLFSVDTSKEIALSEWNITHKEKPINNWNHNYGVIPIVIVVNTLGENGETYNGFENALKHINKLDRIEDEIDNEIVGSRNKIYYDEDAFSKKEVIDGQLIDVVKSKEEIMNSNIIGMKPTNVTFTGGDSLNDRLKANVPIIVTQFDRNGLAPLQTEKDKLITQIYTMLGFTNPNNTSIAPRTATEMEYYNENTASTLKNMSLDRTNTLIDLIALMIQIGVKEKYSGFTEGMTVDDLLIKVIPNIKTDESAFLDLQLKKYNNNLLTFKELKEIIDNSDKDVIDKWVKDNVWSLLTESQVKIYNDLSGEIDQRNRLKILFDGLIDENVIDEIIKNVENERPQNPFMNDGFDDIEDEDDEILNK